MNEVDRFRIRYFLFAKVGHSVILRRKSLGILWPGFSSELGMVSQARKEEEEDEFLIEVVSGILLSHVSCKASCRGSPIYDLRAGRGRAVAVAKKKMK